MRGEVWSCGGGTQSAAIAAMIVKGDLPKPDVAVIADTGREASETWDFYDRILKPELANVGVDLVRLPHSFVGKGWNTVDLWSGKNKDTVIIPMFTSKDKLGKLPKYCSNEWKQRPVQRYIRSLGYKEGLLWIGFSIDEFERMRSHDPKSKWNHAYPLVDAKMSRADCIALVKEVGWGTPPRSACWMCPYRNDQEWRHLKQTAPDDFKKAVALEHGVRERDPHAYLHRSLVPIDQANLNDDQGDMFPPCETGMCFT